MLAIVMPTFSESSVTLIFRFANMTSMLMMIGILVPLYRQVVLGFHIYGALQESFKHGRGRGNYGRDKDQKKTHHNTARNVILLAALNYKEVAFCPNNKGGKDHRAVFYDPQSSHRTL